jgi:hypothetical protein
MEPGDRVALHVDASWTGRASAVVGTLVDVDFDNGGTGKGIDIENLRVMDMGEQPPQGSKPKTDEDERCRGKRKGTKDKSWPPKNLETKVPTPGGRK